MKGGKVRLTRYFQSGKLYINDHREKVDKKTGKVVLGKDKKPELEVFRHILRTDKAPKPVNEKVKVFEKDRMGNYVDKDGKPTEDEKQFVQAKRKSKRTGKVQPVFEQKHKRGPDGKKLWQHAPAFEVNDLEFVLSEHSGILEKC